MTTEGAPVRRWPISQYVIKVHSRCDLACDHCYVYEHADQSWRGRPRVMSPATVRAATGRIAEHAAAHHLPRVTVVLHGGEPLLLGPARMREVLATVRAGIDPVTRLDLRMQSNGLRLSEEFCALFAEYDVRVGISLDGDRTANDRHRRFADGRGSHDRVAQALRLLRRPEYRRQYAGILCTVDVANDPVAVYQALRSHEPPRVDLLLPHATWDSPPARPAPEAAPYAGWLLAVYDRWVAEGRPMAIRLFDALRSTARGGPSGSEWVGLDRADLVVIETDGAWEQVDSLKTAYDGAPATGLDVASHAVDEVSVLPQIVRRQTGLADLSGQCRGCPVVRQCGGGLFAHRYRSGTGFDNPSVYCADLKELIVGLNARMRAEAVPAAGAGADLPDGLLERIGSGRTDGDAVRFLAAGQSAINRALLVAVARAGTAEVRSAWDLLARLDREAPAAVAATLAHPYLRVWAAGTLRGVTADTGGSGYLANVALAAALRAGVPADLDVAARAGTVVLPGLGTVQVPAAVTGTVRLAATPEHLTVHHGGTSARVRLVPAHRLVTADYDLLLEDTDPHRDCYGEKVLDRMSAPSISRWAATVREAWQVIGADAPQHRDALAAGLRALVPLVADPAEQRSATAQDAFGSIALAPAPAADTAVLIVHEFQHNVLAALLDLCELVRPSPRRIQVGWRPDPRPLGGVLHGVHAHLSVADMWRRRAGRPGAPASAGQRYESYRAMTGEAAGALLASGALTPGGERFVTALADTLAGWPR